MLRNVLVSQSCPNRLGLGVFAQCGSVWVFFWCCWVSLAHYVRFRLPRPGSVPFLFLETGWALFSSNRLCRRIRFQRDEVALKKAQNIFTNTLSDRCFNCKIGLGETGPKAGFRKPGPALPGPESPGRPEPLGMIQYVAYAAQALNTSKWLLLVSGMSPARKAKAKNERKRKQ